MTNMARRVLPIAIIGALLSACGGGGSSPPPVIAPVPTPTPTPTPTPVPPPVTTSVNVAAAWHDYVTAPHSWNMRGQGTDKRAYSLTVEMKPGPTAAFPMTGSVGQTIAQSLRFAIDGANTVSSDGTLYFTNTTMIGVATTDGACTGARAAMIALPSSAAAGESGAMFTLDGYAGCRVTGQQLGSTVFSWSVEKDGDLNMFCITSKQQDGTGAAIGTEVDCIEASAAGTLGGKAKFTITRPDGNSISGRNY
jgi:hypothetical protein